MSTLDPPAAPTATSRTVTVIGVASTTARPDRASLSLGVEVRRATAAEAMDLAAQRAGALIAAVKDTGVGDDDVRTTSINLWHDQQERTYVASQQLSVRVAPDRVGPPIDAAAIAGGNEFTMHGISFSIADPAELVAPLRAVALADARARATTLAEAEGATVGVALDIVEGGGHGPVFAGGRAERMLAAMPVEVGSETLTLNVTVTYQLR